MKIRVFLMLAAALAALPPAPLMASGSAPSRRMPPKKEAPATPAPDASDGRYATGQQVYVGTAPMAAKPDSMASQKPRLTKIASMVPDANKRQSLIAMAGKLSAAQLDAVEYFVSVRFLKK